MAGSKQTNRRRRSWWTTWWGAGALFVVTCALVYQPATLLFAFAGVAWTGCAFDCGPTDRPLAVVQYAILAVMIATPVLTLVFAVRAWIGWLTGALAVALASWCWFLYAMGAL